MATLHIGILHPGEMGISVAASALAGGHHVYWASEGRSPGTRDRAEKFALRDAQTVAALCKQCSILISICPPHAAEAVAQGVAACAFKGLYLDANAISPGRARYLDQTMAASGIAFVDGGIIGGPAWEPDGTWLYLSGPRASEIVDCFSAGPLMTQVLGESIGAASALKMCFAAYTKGTTALLCAIVAAADSLSVREALYAHWAREDADFAGQVTQRICRSTRKAWRFAGEMEEIAATFREVGMPGEFHAAAATLYGRLAGFKDRQTTPALEEVLGALRGAEDEPDV